MKRLSIIIGVVVVLLAILIWRMQPDQVLKRESRNLIGMLNGVEGGIKLLDANKLDKMLADEITISAEVVSREELEVDRIQVLSAYQWMGDHVKKSRFEIVDFIKVEINGSQARVEMLVEGMIEMPDIRSLDGRHHVELRWVEVEGKWKLTAVAWEER